MRKFVILLGVLLWTATCALVERSAFRDRGTAVPAPQTCKNSAQSLSQKQKKSSKANQACCGSSSWQLYDYGQVGHTVQFLFYAALNSKNECKHYFRFYSTCTNFMLTYTTFHSWDRCPSVSYDELITPLQQSSSCTSDQNALEQKIADSFIIPGQGGYCLPAQGSDLQNTAQKRMLWWNNWIVNPYTWPQRVWFT